MCGVVYLHSNWSINLRIFPEPSRKGTDEEPEISFSYPFRKIVKSQREGRQKIHAIEHYENPFSHV